MKKEAVLHFGVFLVFFIIYSVLHRVWQFDPLVPVAFLMGGIVGTILPDVDHLIYIYLMRPDEYASLRTQRMVKKGEFWEAMNFLSEERERRSVLILHSIYFLVILVPLMFLLLSSGGSNFGAGLIFAFYLHLLVDLVFDYKKLGNIRNWYQRSNLNLTNKQEKLVMLGAASLFVLFGLIY